MARRQRKPNLPDVQYGPILKAFLICLLIGGAAVGYVRQSHENSVLDRRITRLQNQLMQLYSENDSLKAQVDWKYSNSKVQEYVVHLGLDLGPCRPGQVVHLPSILAEPRMLAVAGRGEGRRGAWEGGR